MEHPFSLPELPLWVGISRGRFVKRSLNYEELDVWKVKNIARVQSFNWFHLNSESLEAKWACILL